MFPNPPIKTHRATRIAKPKFRSLSVTELSDKVFLTNPKIQVSGDTPLTATRPSRYKQVWSSKQRSNVSSWEQQLKPGSEHNPTVDKYKRSAVKSERPRTFWAPTTFKINHSELPLGQTHWREMTGNRLQNIHDWENSDRGKWKSNYLWKRKTKPREFRKWTATFIKTS